ncbi:DUF1947 domain-containing protein [Thermofilum pendens]|uniref:DUF1947 domain-containing protein n=1 Tax=Thermofilum pendens TaxID=2269 RepID=UPI0000DCF857|nr:DUF1947 domain-containing protein [Thermofilum pendens]
MVATSKSGQALKITSRYLLSKKDRKKVEEDVKSSLGEVFATYFEKASRIEVASVKHEEIEEMYYVDGVLTVVKTRSAGLVPTLFFIYKNSVYPVFPNVYVDSGAVPRILNGADVMVPGIKKIDGEFKPGDRVLVREIEKNRVIALGIAIMGSDEIRGAQKGKAVRNIHYLGDELWELSTKS